VLEYHVHRIEALNFFHAWMHLDDLELILSSTIQRLKSIQFTHVTSMRIQTNRRLDETPLKQLFMHNFPRLYDLELNARFIELDHSIFHQLRTLSITELATELPL
jgi:hypothetical protein